MAGALMDEMEKKLAEKLTDRFNEHWSQIPICGREARFQEYVKWLEAECLRLMTEREWVKVSPETMPEDHTSWLIAWHNYGTGNIVEEAYWNGEHWCLTRTNPCDESIYLDEQVYAYTKIPDAPEREIVLPTEGGKE